MEGERERLHGSLVRPILIGGIEPEPMFVIAVTVVALLAGIGPRLLSLLLCVGLVSGLLPLLRLAAKADPQMRAVYVRHRTYQPVYPATAHPAAPSVVVRRPPR